MTQQTRESWADVWVIAKHVGASVLAILGVLALVAVMSSVAGCTIHEASVRTLKDGTRITTIKGASFLTEKGIAKARVEGLGEIEGWTSRSQEEMFLMMMQTALNVMQRGVVPVPVVVPTTGPVR